MVLPQMYSKIRSANIQVVMENNRILQSWGSAVLRKGSLRAAASVGVGGSCALAGCRCCCCVTAGLWNLSFCKAWLQSPGLGQKLEGFVEEGSLRAFFFILHKAGHSSFLCCFIFIYLFSMGGRTLCQEYQVGRCSHPPEGLQMERALCLFALWRKKIAPENYT